MTWIRPWGIRAGAVLLLTAIGWWFLPPTAAQSRASRSFVVSVRRYAYSPARIEVTEGDVVRIELRTEDIAHSLTIDAYRLSKRVNPGQPVTFEFRADHAGTFPFYCNLQIDDGCRQTRGELVVRPR
jgi:heme/copper-type cytochrome/quinol oxidase subunit 2